MAINRKMTKANGKDDQKLQVTKKTGAFTSNKTCPVAGKAGQVLRGID